MTPEKAKLETEWAKQYVKFKAEKLKPKDAFALIKNLGYNKSRKTLDRHVLSINRTGHALSPTKKNCIHRLLNDEQMSEVQDWVLDQNTQNIPFGYIDVQKFIKRMFMIDVCIRTAGNVLHRLGNTKKSCQTKDGGSYKTNANLKTMY